MRFYAAPPGMGYYAGPASNYGYYAQTPNDYGYYAQVPADYGYYAAPANAYGYYADLPEQVGETEPGYDQYEPVGYVAGEYPTVAAADPYSMGYYAEPGYYGYEDAPLGYYAESPDVDGYDQYEPVSYYGEPEMPGYPQYQPLAETEPDFGGYSADPQDYGAYVRETSPVFNPGCPMPTNVNGYGEAEVVGGYVAPSTVNPTCGQFAPQPGKEAATPDNFKPLW